MTKIKDEIIKKQENFDDSAYEKKGEVKLIDDGYDDGQGRYYDILDEELE